MDALRRVVRETLKSVRKGEGGRSKSFEKALRSYCSAAPFI